MNAYDATVRDELAEALAKAERIFRAPGCVGAYDALVDALHDVATLKLVIGRIGTGRIDDRVTKPEEIKE